MLFNFIKLFAFLYVFFVFWLHQIHFENVDFFVEQTVQVVNSKVVEFQLVLEFHLHQADLISRVINSVDQIITLPGCLQEWNDKL